MLGLTIAFNGCIYNYPELRARTGSRRLPLLLQRRHRGHPQGLARLGRGLRRALQRHVRLRHPGARQRPRHPGARPFRHQAALSVAERQTAALRLVAAGPARGRRRRHLDRPRRAAPLHELPRRRAAAAHHPQRRAQAAAGDDAHHRGRRPASRTPLLGRRPSAAPPTRARISPTTGAIACSRNCATAVKRRMVADVPVGVLLSGGVDSSLIVGLLAEAGQTGLMTFSDRLRGGQWREGRRVRLFRPDRQAVRHRPPQDLRALRAG